MDEVFSDLPKKQEVISTPEQNKIASAKVQVADQDNYQYAQQKEKAQDLENAERDLINSIIEVSGTYDRQIPTILGDDFKKRSEAADQLQDEFEEAIRDLNPKGKQISSQSGSVEIIEPREPLEHLWQYGNPEEYRTAREKFGHAGFLALRMIESDSLKSLSQTQDELDKVRRRIGLGSSSSWERSGTSYSEARRGLDKKLTGFQIAELETIVRQKIPPIEFGNPQTPEEARKRVLEKMERDLPFSIVKEKYDKGGVSSSVFREIHTFTVDPKTGIRFITQRGFQRRGGKEEFEPWGHAGISGFGPDGEIYYLSPQYNGPAYSTRAGEDWNKFKPFYRSKGTYSGVAPSLTDEKQIEIWQAYCRAECDIDATKDDFRKDSDWRYGLEEIYWGDQMDESEQFTMLRERLKKANLLKEADSSDFGKVRLGIAIRQNNIESSGEVLEEAPEEQLRQIQEIYDSYWQNPNSSEFVVVDYSGLKEFNYPYASRMSVYPDDYGKTIKVRFTKGEILIRDAFDEDTGSNSTRYLKIGWDEEGNWKVERGRHSHTTDNFFLEPDETRSSLTKKDAEAVLSALGLLNQPKQKRS